MLAKTGLSRAITCVLLLLLLVYYCGWERPDPVISDEEVAKLEQRFMAHAFPATYQNRRAVNDQVHAFQIPGGGLSVIGKLTNSRSESFCVNEIAVPGRGRDLIIIFRYDPPPAESYQFVHRFIIESKVEDELLQPLRIVKIEDGYIRYYSDGREYKSAAIPAKK